ETIREYASQKLKISPSLSSVHDRHGDYFLKLAKQWNDQVVSAGADAPQAMHIFTTEIDNMRSGMDWFAQQNTPHETIDYAKALFPFLRARGLYDECDTRLILAEDAARQIDDLVDLARLLNQRGLVALDRSDFAPA